ncbi:hypothetical protein GRJ2_002840400 [Grus japonensis]|uniref:ribonuclease H n=1 Tax=Grus japonensis TaxID=30415 RepID=A0ABC9Y143_GRUJA
MVEATTRCLETYPVPHATFGNAILGLEKQVLWRHGSPKEIIESDNGTHFQNNLIDTWAKEHGIEWVCHIPYHAPASGKMERYNGLLKTTLRAMGGGTLKHWDTHLAKATWLVNTRGSANRAGPAQSKLPRTVEGDKVPIVRMKNMLGKTVWVSPASDKSKPICGIAFAQGPGWTWWVMQKGGEVQCVPQGDLILAREEEEEEEERFDQEASPSAKKWEEGVREIRQEAETTRSLTSSELRDMQKDYSCQPGEQIAAWLLRYWDNGADSQQLEGKWTTADEGIQYLRELAVLEVIYSDLDDDEVSKDPEDVECMRAMWRKTTSGEGTSRTQRVQWAFGVATVNAEKIKQLSTLPGLSEDPFVVGLLRVEEQQVPIATRTVHRRQYCTNQDSLAPIHELIHQLESQGVISKTHSPFNNLIWPVQKSDGGWRLTVDYRGLNEVTAPLSVAMPDMLELQYELESKAAKCVQYTWNRLPQEWKHSPTICHGLIQTALEKGGAPEHLQYIDDIIVWGNKAEEVFEKGKRVIQILLKAGFTIKKSKVKGPSQDIQLLGIKWQDGRRHVPMDVVNKIATMSPPATKKETQAFLGLVGFWRMHIPGYSQLVSPLYRVTWKKNYFE